MKISVDWRKLWRAYFKLLGNSLLIPLASFLLLIGFIWYEFGFPNGVRHPDALLELAIFKLKLYSVLTLIGLIGMAVTDFIGALLSAYLSPVWSHARQQFSERKLLLKRRIKTRSLQKVGSRL